MGAAETVASEIEPANATSDVEKEECSGHDRSPEGGSAVCKTKEETDTDHEFHADTDAGEGEREGLRQQATSRDEVGGLAQLSNFEQTYRKEEQTKTNAQKKEEQA